jgi:hypothetical protein
LVIRKFPLTKNLLNLCSNFFVFFGVKASVRIHRCGLFSLAFGWGRFLSLVLGGTSICHRLGVDVIEDFFNQVVHSEDLNLSGWVTVLYLLCNGPFASARLAEKEKLEREMMRDWHRLFLLR